MKMQVKLKLTNLLNISITKCDSSSFEGYVYRDELNDRLLKALNLLPLGIQCDNIEIPVCGSFEASGNYEEPYIDMPDVTLFSPFDENHYVDLIEGTEFDGDALADRIIDDYGSDIGQDLLEDAGCRAYDAYKDHYKYGG